MSEQKQSFPEIQMEQKQRHQNEQGPIDNSDPIFAEEMDEDEMVVADMSLVRKSSIFLPERIRNQNRLSDAAEKGNLSSNIDPLGRAVHMPGAYPSSGGYSGGGNYSSGPELSSEETKWAILGTLKAAFLIGGAYIIGLGGLILLLFVLFKNFG